MSNPLAASEDYLDVARANVSAAMRELASAAFSTDRAGWPRHTETIYSLVSQLQKLRMALDEEILR